MPTRPSASSETISGEAVIRKVTIFFFFIYLDFYVSNVCLDYRQNLSVTCDVFMENVKNGGIFVAARVSKGGQDVRRAKGVFFWVFVNGTYKVTSDIGGCGHSSLLHRC